MGYAGQNNEDKILLGSCGSQNSDDTNFHTFCMSIGNQTQELQRQFPLPQALTLTRFTVRITTNNVVVGDATFVINNTGVPTSIVVNAGQLAGVFQDLVNTSFCDNMDLLTIDLVFGDANTCVCRGYSAIGILA